MSLPLNSFTPLARIRRSRVFPAPARVLVRKGQQVEPDDAIAEATLAPRHLSLDLAAGLSQPASEIERYLQFGVGAVISQGDVLAGPVGYSKRVVRAPLPGKIVRIQQGELVLQVTTQPGVLRAGLPGEIVELVEERGAVVELLAALVQGVWGNNRSAYARFVFLAENPEDQLTLNPGDKRLAGAILVGGACLQAEVLRTAQAAGAAGLLVSSLGSDLYEPAEAAPFPIVIFEGFGSFPVPAPIFELLASIGSQPEEGHFMALDARPWDRTGNTRPEAILPRSRNVESGVIPIHQPDLGLIHPDQMVRLLGHPYLGRRGRLVDLPGPSRFASGIQGFGATVRLNDGTEILLPLTNLEFIG